MKKLGKHTIKILKELCKRVGANFNKVNFGKEDWYTSYEWTLNEQKDFEKWLVDYLYKNKEARKEVMIFPRLKTKKHLSKVAKMFVFNYGWKFKDNDELKITKIGEK